jgi:hypothetical protein
LGLDESDRLAVVMNLSTGWRVKKRQNIQQRRFSGTIRAQQRIDAPIFDIEVPNVQNRSGTEAFN